MGVAQANRTEKKRAATVVRMRVMKPSFFLRSIKQSTLLHLAKKEGLAPGDLPPSALPQQPKDLVNIMCRHFRQVHVKKNTLKAMNTPSGRRLRRMASHWDVRRAPAQLHLDGGGYAIDALESSMPASGFCNAVLRNAMCGLVAAIPAAVAAGVYAANALGSA
jgi:hypothetical protein